MPVSVPNTATYLSNLTQHIIVLRGAYQTLVNDLAYLNAMGGNTFLTAAVPNGIGLSSADANAVMAAVGNLGNLPALQTALASSETIWGGQ